MLASRRSVLARYPTIARRLAALSACAVACLAARPAHAQVIVTFGGGGLGGAGLETYRGDDAVNLQIQADDVGSMRLVQKTPAGWTTLCGVPCLTPVDPRGLYRIEGDLVTSYGSDDDDDDGPSVDKVGDSSPFRLGPSRNQSLVVHPRSAYGPLLGWVFLPIGAGFAGLGGATVAGALDKSTTFRLGLGLPFLAAGTAVLALSGYFLFRHGTSVTDESGQRIARRTVKLPRGLAF